MAANPVATDARSLDEQARAIQVELERAERRDCFRFQTRWAAQPLDLLREMVKLKPTVVHFCGSRLADRDAGVRAAGVYFQAADGRAQLVSAAALASAFDAAGSVRLVVLDACYSETHAEAVAAHIDCVVGMAGETVDGAAISFAIGLYGGLGGGEPVAAAFKQGRAAIALMGIGDAEQPQLRTRRGVNASRLILSDLLPPLSSSSEVAAPTALVDEHSRISADVGGLDVHAGVIRGGDLERRRVVGVAIPAGTLVVAALFTGWIALRPTSRETARTMVRVAPADMRPGAFDASRRPQSCAGLDPDNHCDEFATLGVQGSGSASPAGRTDSALTVMTRLRIERSEPGRTTVFDDVRTGTEVTNGDHLQLMVWVSQDAYLYLAYCSQHDGDSSHEGLSLFPKDGGLRIAGDMMTTVPSSGSIVIDDKTGRETFYVIVSKDELSRADARLADNLRRAKQSSPTGDCNTKLQSRPVKPIRQSKGSNSAPPRVESGPQAQRSVTDAMPQQGYAGPDLDPPISNTERGIDIVLNDEVTGKPRRGVSADPGGIIIERFDLQHVASK